MSDMDFEGFSEGLKNLQSKFGVTNEALGSFIKQVTKETKNLGDFQKALKNLQREVDRGRAGYIDQRRELDSLQDAIEDLTEDIEKASDEQKENLKTQKEALEADRELLASQAMVQGVFEDTAKTTKDFGRELATGVASFTKNLQANVSGNQLATGLIKTTIDIGKVLEQGLGSVLDKIGSKMMDAKNPLISGLGVVTSGFGVFLNKSAEVQAEILKFGVEVLSAEVEKTYKAFNQIGASGVMFADGMTGMRNAAGAAGLTVEQFAGVLKNQSANISASGLGMTEGAKRIGGALTAGGTLMKKSLLNLGFGFEEQAELVAETMKSMRGSTSGPLRASNQQVAEQTQKYAENLRIIAAITGEDAKKKMAQVQDEANQLAFQQKLALKSPEEQAAIIRGFSNMNSLQRKNFMDMVNFGDVINTEGAAAASLSSGLRDSVSEAYQAYNEGNLDEARQREINSKYNTQMQKEALDQTAIGLAGAAGIPGLAGDLARSLMTMVNEIKSGTPEAIKAAEEAAKNQKTTTDSFTNAVVASEVAAQNLKRTLEQDLTLAITKFSEVSLGMLTLVESGLEKMGFMPGGGTSESGNVKNSSAANPRPNIVGRSVFNGPSQSTGNPLNAGAPQSVPSYADGGIASGSISGYSATLHGTEAVVPLPDNRSIPVSLDSSS